MSLASNCQDAIDAANAQITQCQALMTQLQAKVAQLQSLQAMITPQMEQIVLNLGVVLTWTPR
jgi:flagellar biosynthesis chaperone FliJ